MVPYYLRVVLKGSGTGVTLNLYPIFNAESPSRPLEILDKVERIKGKYAGSGQEEISSIASWFESAVGYQ